VAAVVPVTMDLSKVVAAETVIAAVLVPDPSVRVVAVQPKGVTDNELAHAPTGTHSLQVGVPEMDAFPNACVNDLLDCLAEPGPGMIEGCLWRIVISPSLSTRKTS
jgi:hypothetical protein